MKKSGFTETQIISILKLAGAGLGLKELCAIAREQEHVLNLP
jgi:hypothetical protein